MAHVKGYSDFVLCYKTQFKNVVHGHNVYQSVWTSTVGENLSLLQTRGKKCSVMMSLPSAYINMKTVFYWLGTYRSKLQAYLIIF